MRAGILTARQQRLTRARRAGIGRRWRSGGGGRGGARLDGAATSRTVVSWMPLPPRPVCWHPIRADRGDEAESDDGGKDLAAMQRRGGRSQVEPAPEHARPDAGSTYLTAASADRKPTTVLFSTPDLLNNDVITALRPGHVNPATPATTHSRCRLPVGQCEPLEVPPAGRLPAFVVAAC